MSILSTLITVLVAACALTGSFLMLVTAIAMLRARDAFARINVLSPATGLGMPLIVLAGFLHHGQSVGFTLLAAAELVVTIGALLVVSSVASNVLARAAYQSGAPVDPATDPQDLARAPDADH